MKRLYCEKLKYRWSYSDNQWYLSRGFHNYYALSASGFEKLYKKSLDKECK
jgi:hypothetical protein